MKKRIVSIAILVLMPFTLFAQSQRLTEGTEVLTDDNFPGTIVTVFPDDLVIVNIGGSNFKYKMERLSKSVSCIGGFSVGKLVKTDDHHQGTIKRIFSNYLSWVEINGKVYPYNIDQLSRDGSSCPR